MAREQLGGADGVTGHEGGMEAGLSTRHAYSDNRTYHLRKGGQGRPEQ